MNPEIPQDTRAQVKVTAIGVLLKLNKYFALSCGCYISYLCAKMIALQKQRKHIAKQLVYSPSIVQQSNKKLNEYLTVMTGQVKEFLQTKEAAKIEENLWPYGQLREKFETFEVNLSKTMKQIDQSIQKYYKLDQEQQTEHIPVTFVKEGGKTTIKLNRVLVIGKIDPEHLPNTPYLSSIDDHASYLLFKRTYKEELCMNNLLTQRKHPSFGHLDERVGSFKLNDSQKEMTIIVKNFNTKTIITNDCFDHRFERKDIVKIDADVGVLFASLMLSPLTFYKGIQIGVQDCEIGIKANGIFCLLGDLIFDPTTQEFRMDNLEFMARSKQAILDYYQENIGSLQFSIKLASASLAASTILYLSIRYFTQIKKFADKTKKKFLDFLLFLYIHM